MALFVIVQSVTINSESWPSISGEALEDLDLLWESMEEAWTTPDFPRGSPVFPHMDARTLRFLQQSRPYFPATEQLKFGE